jgi:hypothetical protein
VRAATQEREHASDGNEDRVRLRLVVAGVGLLLCLPLLVCVVWYRHHDRWAPVYDIALFEIRLRDVGTAHTPLIGFGGRLGKLQHGSHPGPMAFYLLTPLYRLLGGTYWALRASVAAMNAFAIVSTLAIVGRRAGTWAVLAVGVAFSLIEAGYGLLTLTEPWNPYLPLFWFALFLAAVWSVADGERRLLPIVAATASICAEIHVSFVAICGGIGLFALVPFVRSFRRADARGRMEHLRLGFASVAIVLLLWIPPILEQLTHAPGNLRTIADYFAHPPEPSVGLWIALTPVFQHLDVVHLVVDTIAEPGIFRQLLAVRHPDVTRGVVCFAVWVIAALATRNAAEPVRLLHRLVLASIVVFWIAVSRIIGVAWPYLILSGWMISGAMLVATVSTLLSSVLRDPSRRASISLAGVAFALMAASALRLSLTVGTAGSVAPTASAQLAVLARDTVAGIRRSPP